MKKIYLFAIVAMVLSACKPTPEQLANQFILNHAVDPTSIRILSHSEVLQQERTKLDTFYHITAFGNDVAFSDSIRIETRHLPEHYYCYWTIEGNDSTDQPCHRSVTMAVFPDGKVMFYDKYRDTYYGAVETEVHAQRDTIKNIRNPGFYTEPNVWAHHNMLLKYN